ncbi:hypothetical protein C475_11850 [Halosimplex carlsbadense 2-9-1]|uniref:Uncharacterized protein n=1 Tax=Halosimplex carlsbadense 2-9-1 TaxID=797114 RepID=M0CST6_9EURY|nr:DUF58 domain-containing protein [Halosimplex carlsbadense]ELZ24929.1 hypothetical protein C475_11850 [Halosimplex carlsbadense 2-9-1]
MRRRRVRWRGAVAAALVLAVAGVWNRSATLVLAAAIPLVFVAYGTLSTVDSPEDLAVSRAVDPTPAPPGRPVSVALTATNEGDRTLSDLRLVDGVPDDLQVVDGSPRAGTTLDPGETVTVEYIVVARRGEYDFEPPRARLRSGGAGMVATTELHPSGDERLVCRLDAGAPPLSERGDDFVGRLSADRPGRGVQFHSTREYRHGDAADRIDWRGYAQRGELATVEYERWVSTTVVVVLDARERNRVAAGPGRPTAVERSAYAAVRTVTALMRAGHDVGLAVVGQKARGPGGLDWIEPGTGSDHRSRLTASVERAVEYDVETPVDATYQFRKVAEVSGPRAQLLLVSPLLDGRPVEAVETWASLGRAQTVLSPDVVSATTVGGRLDGVERRTRLARCQSTGARTVDWRRETPLALALEYALEVEARRSAGAPGGGA